jgi:hypothetical protein
MSSSFGGFFFGGKFSLFCDLFPKKKTSEKSNFVIVKCGFSAHKNSPLLQD